MPRSLIAVWNSWLANDITADSMGRKIKPPKPMTEKERLTKKHQQFSAARDAEERQMRAHLAKAEEHRLNMLANDGAAKGIAQTLAEVDAEEASTKALEKTVQQAGPTEGAKLKRHGKNAKGAAGAIITALLMLTGLPSCTIPPREGDQFRIAQGMAMQGQVAAQQQASLLMAGRQVNRLAPMQTLPFTPMQPLSNVAR